MTADARPATIVGAGIAGLTAALCLARDGREVEILERAPRLEEAGAGLQLSPNALRVLSRLGLLSRLAETGVVARAVTLRSGRTGRPLARVPVSSFDDVPYLSILRSDLQAALLEAVDADPRIRLTLDQSLVSVVPVAGARLDIVTVDGAGVRTERASLSLLVGADGVRSAVARSLGLAPPRATGFTAFRTMLDRPFSSGAIEAWLGARHHAVAYPVAGGARTNLVAIGRAATGDGGETRAIDRAELLRRFAGWDPRLLDAFDSAGPIAAWPLFETDAMDEDLAEGVVLIGDAAHAMLPFAAQGAAMAIEDAAVLAHALATSVSPAEAIGRFRRDRRPRLDKVRRRVAFHRFVYHLPAPLASVRNAALALRSQAALRRDLAWLYDWTPPKP